MEYMNVTATEIGGDFLRRAGYLFYMVKPSTLYREKIEDVTDFYTQVMPILVIGWILEQSVRFLQKQPLMRGNETVTNVNHGILMELYKIPFKGAEVWIYAWVYNNYRLVTLPWDSIWTWLISWVVTDFCYYTMHRAFHQINILWAFHVVHHTPEDMTITAPMRNNMFLIAVHWLTYLPMALAIPPTSFLVHYHLSIIYQTWLHTETIGKLPAWIEYIFTTPCHHRAHHGRNRRYIDKNFGGYFILWDRIFGTFAEYDNEDKPLYGTVKQVPSLNPLVLQTYHFRHIWNKVREYKTLNHKLSAIFKGPGWAPGKPWNGNIEDVPEPAEKFPKYDPQYPTWYFMYIAVHFLTFLGDFLLFHMIMESLPKSVVYTAATFFFATTISYGFLIDKSSYALSVEFLRCIGFFVVDKVIFPHAQLYGSLALLVLQLNRFLFTMSLAFWISLISYEQLLRSQKSKILEKD